MQTGGLRRPDVKLEVNLEGKSFPEKIYLITDQGRFLMSKTQKNKAEIVIENVSQDVDLMFYGNGFESKRYLLMFFRLPPFLWQRPH